MKRRSFYMCCAVLSYIAWSFIAAVILLAVLVGFGRFGYIVVPGAILVAIGLLVWEWWKYKRRPTR